MILIQLDPWGQVAPVQKLHKIQQCVTRDIAPVQKLHKMSIFTQYHVRNYKRKKST